MPYFFAGLALFAISVLAEPVTTLTVSDDILPGLQKQLRFGGVNQSLINDIENHHEVDFTHYRLKKIPHKIRFTVYFTPVIDIASEPDDEFCHAIHPELAWAKDPRDIKKMQYQGSGIGRYDDGSLQLFSYHSTGERMLFRRKDGLPRGASGIELTPDYSVAVDPKVVPFGSVLLAHIAGKWRLLLAQDSGSHIKGPTRMDLYLGVGKEGRTKDELTTHKGEAWVIEPKP